MMINTRSAAAFSITRLRAIQKWQAKKFGQAHLSERKSADMPCSQFRRPICPCTEIHHPHHSKSCICWFKFQLYRVVGLVVGCMMQVAAPSCIIAVASYVCLFVRLSVCMSGQSHATSMIQVLKKVTERKDIPLSLVCPYNYYYLIPLCKAGLNPCVNVLSKHYIHIL